MTTGYWALPAAVEGVPDNSLIAMTNLSKPIQSQSLALVKQSEGTHGYRGNSANSGADSDQQQYHNLVFGCFHRWAAS